MRAEAGLTIQRQDRMAGVKLPTCTTSARVIAVLELQPHVGRRRHQVTCTLNRLLSGAHDDGRRQWRPVGSQLRGQGVIALLFGLGGNAEAAEQPPMWPQRPAPASQSSPCTRWRAESGSSIAKARAQSCRPSCPRHPCGRRRESGLPSAQHGWLPGTATLQVGR